MRIIIIIPVVDYDSYHSINAEMADQLYVYALILRDVPL